MLGGVLYEYFGLKKLSPTVGLYFYADDYIRFLSNIRYYVSLPIEMVTADKSKYAEKLRAKGQLNVPVGKLEDVEIVFLHYSNPEIARDKWIRRVKRINWDNLIVKFSYMNDATDEHIKRFAQLSFPKKFAFVTKPYPYKDVIQIPGDGQIANDTENFSKYIDIYELINR